MNSTRKLTRILLIEASNHLHAYVKQRTHRGCLYQMQWESYRMSVQCFVEVLAEGGLGLWSQFADAPKIMKKQLQEQYKQK